jgi:hypothetical protein
MPFDGNERQEAFVETLDRDHTTSAGFFTEGPVRQAHGGWNKPG